MNPEVVDAWPLHMGNATKIPDALLEEALSMGSIASGFGKHSLPQEYITVRGGAPEVSRALSN